MLYEIKAIFNRVSIYNDSFKHSLYAIRGYKMITRVVNLGKLTESQALDVDCECDNVMQRIYMLDDCNACYSMSTDDNGNTLVNCHDGFEMYWQASNEIGY